MSELISITYYQSPVGEMILGVFDDKLCLADWRYRKMRTSIDNRITGQLKAEYKEQAHPLHQLVIDQLNEYFEGKRAEFDIPLLLVGTEFQRKVWEALLQIPFGTKITYLGLSTLLGDPKAIRAVATANGANAISIMVPCHRIIGSDNTLIGYAGGLPAKKKLLVLEKSWDDSQMSLF